MPSRSTTDLLAAACSGDEAAWSLIVDRYSRLVWSVVAAVGARGAAADDIYQTTWLRLVEHRDRIRNPERLSGWLATTARNEAIRQGRLAARSDPLTDDGLVEAEGAAEGFESVDESDVLSLVWSALGQLADDCRRLLGLMATAPDLTYREIGEILDRPVGWIGPTRARCLAKLRANPKVQQMVESRR